MRFCISNALFTVPAMLKNAKSADKLVSVFFEKKCLWFCIEISVAIALTGVIPVLSMRFMANGS